MKKLYTFKNGPVFLAHPVPPNLSHAAKTVKTVLKIDSYCGWGCTSCPGGALTHFPCKLGLRNFFSPPWGVQVHPLHPLSTPMSRQQLRSASRQLLVVPRCQLRTPPDGLSLRLVRRCRILCRTTCAILVLAEIHLENI